MQTFMTSSDYDEVAMALDNKRLNKQRVECKQIFIAHREGRGMIHHPAVKMWEGYPYHLAKYAEAMCLEWLERGGKDDADLLGYFRQIKQDEVNNCLQVPNWIYNHWLHASHKSKLYNKAPSFYPQWQLWGEGLLPYFWPVANPETGDWLYKISQAESKRPGEWKLPKGISVQSGTLRVLGMNGAEYIL